MVFTTFQHFTLLSAGRVCVTAGKRNCPCAAEGEDGDITFTVSPLKERHFTAQSVR
ncbi:hypothetical protein KCP69_01525 [Salmonella enterica subsp. enterica]|nr:hypothetical protein KCP69_01525 [Salmonella enterica subsp. enterica]